MQMGDEEPEPLFGDNTPADRTQYVDADSEYGYLLPQAIIRIKTEFPLRAAPVVPSQGAAALSTAAAEDSIEWQYYVEDGQGGVMEKEHDGNLQGQVVDQDDDVEHAQQEAEDTSLDWSGCGGGHYGGGHYDGGHEPGPASSAAAEAAFNFIEVNVTKIPHTFKQDEFCFTDRKGNKKSTSKEHWRKTKYGDRTVWVFEDKKATYLSRTRIS